jgi:hypothetical protein
MSGDPGSPVVALQTLLPHSFRDRLLSASEFNFLFMERDPTNLTALEEELSALKAAGDENAAGNSGRNARRVACDSSSEMRTTVRLDMRLISSDVVDDLQARFPSVVALGTLVHPARRTAHGATRRASLRSAAAFRGAFGP